MVLPGGCFGSPGGGKPAGWGSTSLPWWDFTYTQPSYLPVDVHVVVFWQEEFPSCAAEETRGCPGRRLGRMTFSSREEPSMQVGHVQAVIPPTLKEKPVPTTSKEVQDSTTCIQRRLTKATGHER